MIVPGFADAAEYSAQYIPVSKEETAPFAREEPSIFTRDGW